MSAAAERAEQTAPAGSGDSAGPPVAARGLGYAYPSGRRGLIDVDLDVRAGERVVVLGPNGSGKSTLVHLLNGLLRPASGRVSVLGTDSTALSAAERRRLGTALDRIVHLDPLTGLENATLLARAAGLGAKQAAAATASLLMRFGLEGRVPVGEYSLGMRRKLLLVEALVHDPEVILLDEPTLGLDPEGVEVLVTVLRERSEAGAAVLVASNDVHAARLLGTRVVFLIDGRKVTDEPAEALLARLRSQTRIAVALADEGTSPADVLKRTGAPRGIALREEGDSVVVDSPYGAEPLPDLLRWLLDGGARVSDVRVREPDLADVFRQLTGRSLEGGAGP